MSKYPDIEAKCNGHSHPNQLSGTNPKAIVAIVLWYFFSGCTLFLNKYVVAYMKGDPVILATIQLFVTSICALFQLYYPCGIYEPVHRHKKPDRFYLHMGVVGTFRFATVFLGLIALNYVEVSFAETVKSTAPAFTVLISRLVLGEITGIFVNVSLIPVMGGLALCSANELSFSFIGFIAALSTNVAECMQFVFAKLYISGKDHKYTPAEVQYYTCVMSLVVQIPSLFLFLDPKASPPSERAFLLCCLLNGFFYHCQTMCAFVLMDYISPVTHSVTNTAKRALLIWLSVILFGNPVTFLSGLGTAVVFLGVIMYTKAKQMDRTNPNKVISINAKAMDL